MATVGRVVVLLWVDILAIYAMYVMMAYLTDVWKLGFTDAALIVNAFWGVAFLAPLLLTHLVDTFMGNFSMLLISSLAYAVGLGLLAMSTPPVMGNCKEYKPECISHGQKNLFYAALSLAAFGMAGHMASFNAFLAEQIQEEVDNLSQGTFWRFFTSVFVVIIVTVVAVIALPYIRPWSIRFGIPAICTLVATLLFMTGSCSYNYVRPQGSPLTVFIRVFVATTSKLFFQTPSNPNQLYEIQNPEDELLPHTRSLRCLDKAAIIVPSISREEQERNRWTLCRVTEVEETKTIIRMIPVWMTFILCGVVSAIGLTFFVQQLEHLNHKVGRLTLPTVVLLWFYEQSQNTCSNIYNSFAMILNESGLRKFAPPIGIISSMILAILCCITAAKVEERRLGVVERHGLIDKPDETVPMTMFWLLPQLLLLGAFDGIFNSAVIEFFIDQSPASTRRYIPLFISGVFGIGMLGSILCVFVVGKISERGGNRNWFQHDLNASRVDKYFWTLSWLMAANLAVFIVVAILYRYNESQIEDDEPIEFGGLKSHTRMRTHDAVAVEIGHIMVCICSSL